mmetsp:Transcript_36593/g.80368  ORF Transcript_36593/g.80368 Transcript_36593/m.80368 type:complete len:161 (-) Transcript_36593:588-1070(-)
MQSRRTLVIDVAFETATLQHLPTTQAAFTGDIRSRISDYLKHQLGLPLDLRTKEEGGVALEKFYEGSEWHRFCCGGGHSPGGPVIIAQIVMMVAEYYEKVQAEANRSAAARPPRASASSSAPSPPRSSGDSRPKKRKKGGVVLYTETEVEGEDDVPAAAV